jgi:hypothetical protein
LEGSRLIATTVAPASASCLEVAKPIPDVPPKTMAFLPFTFNFLSARSQMFDAVALTMRRSASACKCQASPKAKTYGRNANPESASLIEVAPLREDGMVEVRSTD